MSKTRFQRSQSITEPASVKDDNILCCACDAVVQIEPSDLYDELVKYASKSKNMKFYCDNCVKHADGFKGLLQMLNEKFESIDSRLKTFDSIDIGMKNLQLRLESSDENLKQLEKLDEKLNQSINSLKNDITKSWSDVVKSNSKIVDNEAVSLRNMISTSFSDVVKKDLDVVSKEVISVRRKIEVANEVKARENNIVLFNFSEDLDVAKDRGNVLGFLRSLTDESLKDDDILKIFRQGKQPSVSSPPRPVIVKFINLSAKVLVMRRLFRLALLDKKMREVRISDDLTTDQRLQLKKLVLEAKRRESKNGHFLYRVRGVVGQWRIVRYPGGVSKKRFVDAMLKKQSLLSEKRKAYWRNMIEINGSNPKKLRMTINRVLCKMNSVDLLNMSDELNSDDFAQFFKDMVDNILEMMPCIKEPIVSNNRMSECAELSLFQCCSSDEIRQKTNAEIICLSPIATSFVVAHTTIRHGSCQTRDEKSPHKPQRVVEEGRMPMSHSAQQIISTVVN
ncbi:hypothetical protein HELRODRAFT_170451 [Helobdella robusta]|uniref:Uncharacterized protein n=1 Tax=Helobdella robusta TaxID=6412 RepID=T1F329_HELRO|nr:hypothetical protein HELRODRAFT_170451 [Helobdella robusta]ESO07147.1 hypothetical protein HELRODRAFT_170451 [Helobdella robusta]